MAELTDRAAELLTNVCQILDVVRSQWAAENAWSEWDQEQRDKISAWLRDYHAQPH